MGSTDAPDCFDPHPLAIPSNVTATSFRIWLRIAGLDYPGRLPIPRSSSAASPVSNTLEISLVNSGNGNWRTCSVSGRANDGAAGRPDRSPKRTAIWARHITRSKSAFRQGRTVLACSLLPDGPAPMNSRGAFIGGHTKRFAGAHRRVCGERRERMTCGRGACMYTQMKVMTGSPMRGTSWRLRIGVGRPVSERLESGLGWFGMAVRPVAWRRRGCGGMLSRGGVRTMSRATSSSFANVAEPDS